MTKYKILRFAYTFPEWHPSKKLPTGFAEKICKSAEKSAETWMGMADIDWVQFYHPELKPKHHTIRKGNEYNVGDRFIPMLTKPGMDYYPVFKPYIEVRSVYKFEMVDGVYFLENSQLTDAQLEVIAQNDGLSISDFKAWFERDKSFQGQIICWSNNVKY